MTSVSRRLVLTALPLLTVAACAGQLPGQPQGFATKAPAFGPDEPPLYPNETLALRALINKWADHYRVPRDLVHAQVKRESTHQAHVRAGPYWGLMQILPQTARTMGFSGPNEQLLNPDVNLQYGVKYLRGAYMVAGGDKAAAMKWYARGYYYEAKRLGMLEATGLI